MRDRFKLGYRARVCLSKWNVGRAIHKDLVEAINLDISEDRRVRRLETQLRVVPTPRKKTLGRRTR